MIRASIDIGSNTVLMLIADVQKDNSVEEIMDLSTVTALGKGIRNGYFSDESMKDTYKALKKYKREIDKLELKPKEVIVTATEASRVAKNANELFDRIKKKLGFEVKTISGEGEAYYTAYGVCQGLSLDADNVTIMDIGGASTEIIKVKPRPFKIISTISLPVGSVRATDWMSTGNFEEEFNKAVSSYNIEDFKTNHLVCVAGSMTSLGSMMKGLSVFKAESVQGLKVDFNDFQKFIGKIKVLGPDELLSQYPFLGKRAHSIVGGAIVGELLAKKLNIKTLEISTYGLRHGTILEGKLDEYYLKL